MEKESIEKIEATNNEKNSELINIDAVAQMLKCSTRHVRRMVNTRRIPRPIKLGALVRWIKADIKHWFAEGCPNCRK
jgi:predicted DNA-binding transcriptional regulator AlpA